MESTATWVEERVADAVNDNRQYLRFGQVRRPARPLDLFDRQGFTPVRQLGVLRVPLPTLRRRRSSARSGRTPPGRPATTRCALSAARCPTALRFADVFRAYAAGNTTPGRTYTEGTRWPRRRSHARTRWAGTTAPPEAGCASTTCRRAPSRSRPTSCVVGGGCGSGVDGPAGSTSPVATVRVFKESGRIKAKPVDLDSAGRGTREIAFSSRAVRRITLTLGNASTRYDCWHQELTYSCQGRARDDGGRFTYRARLVAD